MNFDFVRRIISIKCAFEVYSVYIIQYNSAHTFSTNFIFKFFFKLKIKFSVKNAEKNRTLCIKNAHLYYLDKCAANTLQVRSGSKKMRNLLLQKLQFIVLLFWYQMHYKNSNECMNFNRSYKLSAALVRKRFKKNVRITKTYAL